MTDPQLFAPLGLNAYEAAAYMALLDRPEMTPAEVARRAGIPRQRVYDVLASLVAKGVCAQRSANPKTFSAVDPAGAFDLLAQERATSLEHQRNEAQALAVRLAEQLGPVFARGQGCNDPLAYVEVLSGRTRIARRAQALAEAASKSVDSCIRLPMILTDEQNRAFLETPLKRGLAYRALCDAMLLEEPSLRRMMAHFVGKGPQIRVVEKLPLKMQAFDDEVVLISMQDPAGGQPSYTAVAIRNRGAVAMLNLAFEHLWTKARVFAG